MHLHNKLKLVALSAAVAACLPLSAPVLAAAPEPTSAPVTTPVLVSAPVTAPVPVAEPIYKILPAVNDPTQVAPTPTPVPVAEPIYTIQSTVNDQGKVIDSSTPTTAPVKPAPAPAPADGATDGAAPVIVPIYKLLPTVPAQVYVNAKAVTFDQAPVVQNEELMLPLRAMVEAAGGQVEWSQADHSVHIMVNGYAATFTIGQTQAEIRKVGVFYIREPIVTLAVAPVIEHDRTLVPASVMEQLGITWADHQ